MIADAEVKDATPGKDGGRKGRSSGSSHPAGSAIIGR